MAQHLIDTVPKLVTCTRCGAYVFTCHSSGVRVTVNPGPLSVEQYREALIAGRGTYDQQEQGGRPFRLIRRLPSSKWPPYDNRKVLADHGCGTQAMNFTAVETSELPPHQARANGSDARASDVMSSVATPVTHHRSKREYINAKCETCHRVVGDDLRFMGVEHAGKWMWLNHDYDCRSEKQEGKTGEAPLVPNSQCRCGVKVFELDGVSVDVTPVENEDGLTTYSYFNGKLRFRDEKWRHPQVTHAQGSKNRGWSSNEPYCLAYEEHKCNGGSTT